ncbi:hypothetical protein MPDQ_007608 [Monascus purpureus]|uniref:Uncharacterized protein n=1 Tax=Monascus purpureus TaxID=5098 RepID=A0A507QRQ2_MONPU|nr:hypothetical protein MPDQ_007608 [Monascus purpureus]BDD56100.1 hypothetical protein MAP00_001576 [Monascus purpureus]
MVKASRFVLGTIEQNPLQSGVEEESRYKSLLAISVLLGHGTEDPFVDCVSRPPGASDTGRHRHADRVEEHVKVNNKGVGSRSLRGLMRWCSFYGLQLGNKAR